jgi:hypothetical protein
MSVSLIFCLCDLDQAQPAAAQSGVFAPGVGLAQLHAKQRTVRVVLERQPEEAHGFSLALTEGPPPAPSKERVFTNRRPTHAKVAARGVFRLRIT